MELVTLPARHRRESEGAGADSASSHGPARTSGRSRATQRLAKVQITASIALTAVSSLMQADLELPEFFKQLGKTLAGLTGAKRIAFWRLGHSGALTLQPEPFGFAADSQVHDLKFELAANGGA